MKPKALIRVIVRQSMRLVARIATLDGNRAPLASVLDQAFVDLVDALQERGLSQKVIADMFGMSLRAFQGRLQRHGERGLQPGSTLWEELYGFVQERGKVLRAQVLTKFGDRDEMIVRSVLKDLVESGLIFQAGRGDGTIYISGRRAAMRVDTVDVVGGMVHAAIVEKGFATREELTLELGFDPPIVESALTNLAGEGAVQHVDDRGWESLIAADPRTESTVSAELLRFAHKVNQLLEQTNET